MIEHLILLFLIILLAYYIKHNFDLFLYYLLFLTHISDIFLNILFLRTTSSMRISLNRFGQKNSWLDSKRGSARDATLKPNSFISDGSMRFLITTKLSKNHIHIPSMDYANTLLARMKTSNRSLKDWNLITKYAMRILMVVQLDAFIR